jgi:hypothetical protein
MKNTFHITALKIAASNTGRISKSIATTDTAINSISATIL